jgi:hypothetical protein
MSNTLIPMKIELITLEIIISGLEPSGEEILHVVQR